MPILLLKNVGILSAIITALISLIAFKINAAIAFTSPGDISTHKIAILLKLSFIIIIYITVFAILKMIRSYKTSHFVRYWIKCSLIYLAIMTVVLILIYPGHWVWDEFHILQAVKSYIPYAWQNYFTNVLYTYSLFILPSAISIVLIQITIISLIVGYASTVIKYISKKTWTTFVIFILFLLPPIIINNFYPLRLTLYSYVEILLISYVLHIFYLRRKKLSLSVAGFAFISFLIGLLSFWRSEGIYYLVAVPLVIVVFKLINSDNWNNSLTYLKLAPGIVILSIMGLVTFISSDPRYSITTMINPLSVMVHENLSGEETPSKLKDMNNVLNMDVLREYPSYTEIPAYWNGGLQPGYEGHLNEFKKDYFYIILHNPMLFLNARIHTFLATNALTNHYPPVISVGLLGRDDELTSSELPVAKTFEEQNAFVNPINPEIKTAVTRTLLSVDSSDHLTLIGHTYWNLFISLILLAITLALSIYKKKWLWTIVSIFILARFPIVFLTAPGSYFMYYLPIYMSGLFVAVAYFSIVGIRHEKS